MDADVMEILYPAKIPNKKALVMRALETDKTGRNSAKFYSPVINYYYNANVMNLFIDFIKL